MPGQLFTNNAVSLLASPISAGSSTLAVLAGHGNLFPAITHPGQFFLVTLENETATSREIIKVTGRSGDVFTGLVRGWEGTTPQSWTTGEGADTLVDHRITAGTLTTAIQNNFGTPSEGLTIPVTLSASVSTMETVRNKTCKWIVTIKTADERIVMTEILAVFKVLPETPIFNQYGKTGDKVLFDVDVTSTATTMSLQITNTDISDFIEVDAIRLQHYT